MPERSARRAVEHAAKIIDRWVERRRSFARVPAVSVGIVHDGRVVFAKGYGHANLSRRIPATDTTCYRIASISKTITATAVMQLVERGTVQLDDAVQRFLPWFRSRRDPELANITLRHLLTHMAGIERDGNTAHWENDRFPTLPQIQAHVRQGVRVYRPLETFKYSNLGYAIAGQVITAVSGRSYERHVEEQIITRLGLEHTSPTLNATTRRMLAVGYGRDVPPHPRTVMAHPETHAMAAATGFTSNVRDLCAYMAAHFLGNPILLSDQSKREMQRVHWFNKKTDHHYGVGLDIWKVGQRLIVGHGGGFAGFITRIAWDPERKIGVTVLTNALDDLAGILLSGVFSTVQFFLEHGARFTPRGKRSPNLARYEGHFSSRWSDIEVVSLGGHLVAFAPRSDTPMADATVLERLEGHTFKIGAENEFGYLGERATFHFDRRGRLAGLAWGPNPLHVTR
jgi:CubicO group peptidase (beta-lactamase class C family)